MKLLVLLFSPFYIYGNIKKYERLPPLKKKSEVFIDGLQGFRYSSRQDGHEYR